MLEHVARDHEVERAGADPVRGEVDVLDARADHLVQARGRDLGGRAAGLDARDPGLRVALLEHHAELSRRAAELEHASGIAVDAEQHGLVHVVEVMARFLALDVEAGLPGRRAGGGRGVGAHRTSAPLFGGVAGTR